MTRKLIPLLALLLVFSVALGSPFTAKAQNKTLVWERYDVYLTVLPSGDLDVLERQTIRFTSGTFSFGYAVIPLDKTSGIHTVRVSEPGGRQYTEVDYGTQPYTFWTSRSGDELEIRWNFPAVSNASMTFDLAYTASGAVRIYDEGDKLQWIAIDSERDFPILGSNVTVQIPTQADFLDIDSAGIRAEWEQGSGGKTVTYVAQSQLGPSDTFEIGVEFTHGVVPASVPNWQAAVDEAENFELNVLPFLNLAVIFGAIIIAIGGPMLVFLLWYVRGRDPEVGPVPEYVDSPPSDMPPGVLGSLVDESADMPDVVATIVDLARRGFLEIKEIERSGLFGLGSQDFQFTRSDKSQDGLLRYEKTVLAGIFPGGRSERKLSDLRNKFYTKLPTIQKQLYQELVRRKLFKTNPQSTRSRWRILAFLAGGLAFLAVVLGAPLANLTGYYMCVPAALGLTAVALFIAGSHMPAKTVKGSESAAHWEAFRKYLARIDSLTDLDAASDKFEAYLPYAIAFGLSNSFVRKFAAQANTPAPGWYVPYPRPIATRSAGGGRGRVQASPVAPDLGGSGSGGLQGMSEGLSGGLQNMSDGLTSMLNSTGRILRSAPSSSGSSGGGGFSGGGFSGGGGGGGGARGFG